MTNQKHVDILKQGAEVWNAWRANNLNIVPDLSGSDFCKAHLSRALLFGANLSSTNFSEAVLDELNFEKANLRGAIFTGSNLTWATLDRADLREAKFLQATLQGTRLKNADLRCADFSGADLTHAIFEDAHLFHAVFTSACLKAAKLKKADLSWADFTFADLQGADLTSTNLKNTILQNANLSRTQLSQTDLRRAHLANAILISAKLTEADLREANFTDADLSRAVLNGAILSNTNFSSALLNESDLSEAILIRTNFTKATLTNCRVYGVSAWDVIGLENATQRDLHITLPNQPTITVDNLKVAQFIYLLLNNQEIRDVIDTITSKVVLILGRFTSERIAVLDALREELRKRNYTPVLFDFEKPVNRDITETVSTLAHMARFVIADITDAKSIPQELQSIVPHLPSVPIQPLLQVSDREYSMYEHFPRYPWVLPLYCYTDQASLLQTLKQKVIDPAEKQVKELAQQ